MASVEVRENELRVRFVGWERLMVWRAEVVIPLAAVRNVERVDKPVAHARGGRAGILVSGLLKVGFWGLGTGIRQLVSVRRATPALRVGLDRTAYGGQFDELLISTNDAAELVESINGRWRDGA